MLNRQNKRNPAPKALLPAAPTATGADSEGNAGERNQQEQSKKPVGVNVKEASNNQVQESEGLVQDGNKDTPMEDVREEGSSGAKVQRTPAGPGDKASASTRPTAPAGEESKGVPARQSQRIIKQSEVAAVAPEVAAATSNNPGETGRRKDRAKESSKKRRSTKFVSRSTSWTKSHSYPQEKKTEYEGQR